MPIIVTGERRKDRTTVEPLPRALTVPFVGSQNPSTSDRTDVVTLTGLTVPVAGGYTSCYSSSGYVPFPQAMFDEYGDDPDVERFQWTVQFQSTESGTTAHPTYGDPTSDARFNCAAALAGNHNAWIISMATAAEAWIQATGKELIIRTFHEMDGSWYPWGADGGNNGNTADLLRQAWIYVRNLWLQHSPSSKFVWCPDAYSSSTNSDILDVAWPGESNVDYVGIDVYNWGPSSLGAHGWRTPSQMFSQTKTWFASVAPNRKVIICEVGAPFAPAGSFADNTGDKDAWLGTLATYLAAWPQCIGFLWMQNTNKGGCRVNRLRRIDGWHYPSPNDYGADTVNAYNDHSADAFAAAFASW